MTSAPPRPSSAHEDYDWRVYAACGIIPLLLVCVVVVRIIIEHPKAASSTINPTTLSMTFAGPCPADPAASLSLDPMVFEAKATSVTPTTVTLERLRVFAGQPSPAVTVAQPTTTPAAALQMPTFTTGTTYLLAVNEAGSIIGCGLSGAESSALENLYTSTVG